MKENLGGSNIDDILVKYIFSKLRDKKRDFRSEEQQIKFKLREKCQKAKHELTLNGEATVEYRGIQIKITRHSLVNLLRVHVDESMKLVRKALQKAGSRKDLIDQVLVTGGSTNVVVLIDHLSHYFNIPI